MVEEGAVVWPSWNPAGHLLAMSNDPLDLLAAAHERGDLVWLRLAYRRVLFAFHPDQVQEVLVERAGSFEKQTRGYALLRMILGKGMLTADGDVWKRQRRIANPIFRRRSVEGFADAMVAGAEVLADRWAATDDFVDVAAALNTAALEIACSAFFSTEMGPRTQEVADLLDTLLRGFDRLVTNFWPLSERWPTPANREFHRAIADMNRVIDAFVEERSAAGGGGTDLLGLFLQAGMDDVLLRDELKTMLLAGHETTANTLTWTLHLLGKHPVIADRLAEEVDRVCGDRAPTVADASELPFVEAVLRESMRLIPTVWLTARSAAEDVEIGGEHVPRGTFVFVSAYRTHRHPAFWTDPESFDPERWLSGEKRHRSSYLPFVVGARKCIGEHFAMLEGLLLLAILGRRFRFEADPDRDVVPEPTLTLRPGGGLWMRCVPR